ncbi:uncharacterized protein LOC114321868 [Camellia sinensis]|uniref:uncharacterized protein LOC114321868 n=1 Tax=Camellia sinensis TaxID=4442 RepID=UPI0010366937|nr:uncharacterized protein LOC114321868 [Camellia sinensis]
MRLSKEDKKTIPVWAKFYNIPLEFWNGDGLSRINCAVGTPLFMDQLTASGNHISIARVYVNIQADSLFPYSFSITNEGDSIEIRVEYQGVPSRCAHCNVFGHETKQCLSTQVSKLIELQKETENLSGEEVGWTTVKNKGKQKVGEPSQEMESMAPIEVSSSSNVGRVDSGKEDCVNTYLEDVVTTTDSTADIVTKEVASLEDEITTKATKQVEAFHSDIMDIAKLIHSATEIILKEVESTVESKQSTPSNKGERVENIHSSGNSSKSKSSGKSGSRKKKKVKNHVSSPLICLGDFNAVRFSYEKLGGNASWNSSKELFNNMILDADLEDLSYTGCQFTWSNKRSEGAYIASKIDRALVHKKWLTSYPNSSALFLPSGVSDHSPVVITLDPKVSNFRKPFKFFDFWADHPNFVQKVDEMWRKYIKGSPMFRVCQKLRTLKPILKNLNKKEFSDISTRVSHAKDQLVSGQIKLDKDPLNGDLQTHERVAYAKYVDLSSVQERLAHQKSRVQWLGYGDRNSKFFFKTIKGNINKGRIQSVVLNDGVTFNDLAREVSDKEFIDAFNSLKPSKALGLNGYSAGFFKKSWEVVGKEVVKVGDFRPISCCNTLYKCISKIIADRIKVVLPDLIDPMQSAFVHGRRISDNIFLSQELMRGYHKNSPTPRCAMKVDIMKAYDNVTWDFVLHVLRGMGFPPNIICWVKACITSPSFSICINGSLHGYFKGGQGLRQGDPMSPYLFVMVMEILSKILAKKSTHLDFKFHWRCDKTKIVNLCFADDLMIFCKGDVFTVSVIKEGLDEFQSLSGLSPSPHKSHIFFSGCEKNLRVELLNVIKFNEDVLPVRYLGLPLISTKLKSSDCDKLVERITNRIKSWTNKCLTYAGRAQLIQSILFSMQLYWSSLFILPKKVVKSIESLFRSFFWSGCEIRKYGAKVSWEHVCSPKSEGGLGFKSIEVWNKAAVAKHIWFLFSEGEQSMWCQWVKSYLLKGQSLWRVKMPRDPSWVWRKILSLRPVIYPFILHKIGNGGDVFWFGARVVYDTAFGMDAKVSRIVNNRSWSWPRRRRSFLQELIEHTPLTFTPNSGNDTVIWVPSSDGKFSINSTWNWFRKSFTKVSWEKLLWGPHNIPKLWIVRNNCIFRKEKIPEEIVIKGIVDMIRFRVMSITNLKLHPSDSWYMDKMKLLAVSDNNQSQYMDLKFFEWSENLNCVLSDEETLDS